MSDWLASALGYIPQWLDYQRLVNDQPGVSLAIAHQGKIVLEHVSGYANLAKKEPLTPRHRFRVASHSKTFTAVGIMLLREQGKLSLDDRLAKFVGGLTSEVANVTIAQLLSHSAGLMRDGLDGGQFADRRPFLSEAEYRADLALPQPLPPATNFKYSNHGFALLGKVIEQVTGERYVDWIARNVVDASGLHETAPDYMPSKSLPLARGHTMREPFGRRYVVPGDNPTNDMASATGFVATAGDLAKFFSGLSSTSVSGILKPESRREMTRRHWRDTHSQFERYYGLGTISGPVGPWSWVGHAGGFQGTLTRTVLIPDHDIAISILTNAIDGLANVWFEGVIHILRTIHGHGAPVPATKDWTGRWWGMWGAFDLVPGKDRVLVAAPAQNMPFVDASEIVVTAPDSGKVAKAQAFGDLAEPCILHRNKSGQVEAVQIGGKRLVTDEAIKAEVVERYGAAT